MSTADHTALCPAIVNEILGEESLPVLREEELDWIPLKPLCEGLELNWAGERSRLKHDPKFTCRFLRMDGTDGRAREFLCLPLYQLSGWLLSVSADRVKEEARDKVRAFQQESLEALFGYWHRGHGEPEKPAVVEEASGYTGEDVEKFIKEVVEVEENAPLEATPLAAEPEEDAESLETRVKSVIENVLGDLIGK